jgi:Tol biopolymer transport system component
MKMANQWKGSANRRIGPALWILLLSVPAVAQLSSPWTTHVSVSSVGDAGNADSDHPSVSTDGRLVVFSSDASNLVPNDSNDVRDVFVHDRAAGTTTRVSLTGTGQQSPKGSDEPAISADGRFVAFTAEAGLVPGDVNQKGDVYVVSVTQSGFFAASGGSPSISADGRFLSFWSTFPVVAGDSNGVSDIFVRDRQLATTVRVSVDSLGTEGNADSFQTSAISADGRFVAFESRASNLVASDNNHRADVFVHDLQTGVTDRVSVRTNGNEGNLDSYAPSISADGRHVAFFSAASNLVAGDKNGGWDCFVRDRQAGTTLRVSVGSGGSGATGGFSPSISADGRYVAFESSDQLTPMDLDFDTDIYVHDCQTSTTQLVSTSRQTSIVKRLLLPFRFGMPVHSRPAISADGRAVAFSSTASDLVPTDSNRALDVFVTQNR